MMSPHTIRRRISETSHAVLWLQAKTENLVHLHNLSITLEMKSRLDPFHDEQKVESILYVSVKKVSQLDNTGGMRGAKFKVARWPYFQQAGKSEN